MALRSVSVEARSFWSELPPRYIFSQILVSLLLCFTLGMVNPADVRHFVRVSACLKRLLASGSFAWPVLIPRVKCLAHVWQDEELFPQMLWKDLSERPACIPSC